MTEAFHQHYNKNVCFIWSKNATVKKMNSYFLNLSFRLTLIIEIQKKKKLIIGVMYNIQKL
jgi:hypothetical protein